MAWKTNLEESKFCFFTPLWLPITNYFRKWKSHNEGENARYPAWADQESEQFFVGHLSAQFWYLRVKKGKGITVENKFCGVWFFSCVLRSLECSKPHFFTRSSLTHGRKILQVLAVSFLACPRDSRHKHWKHNPTSLAEELSLRVTNNVYVCSAKTCLTHGKSIPTSWTFFIFCPCDTLLQFLERNSQNWHNIQIWCIYWCFWYDISSSMESYVHRISRWEYRSSPRVPGNVHTRDPLLHLSFGVSFRL